MFVLERRADTNTVVLGDEEALFKRELAAHDLNLVGCDSVDGSRLKVRIRYAHRGAAASVAQDGDRLFITFDEPQRAATPGQFAVLATEDDYGIRVLGSAVIS